MQIPAITYLVENQSLARLQAAEAALLAGQAPAFDVPGVDAAEQLTHVLVAQRWRRHMQTHGTGVAAARRAFAQQIRTWVSEQ